MCSAFSEEILSEVIVKVFKGMFSEEKLWYLRGNFLSGLIKFSEARLHKRDFVLSQRHFLKRKSKVF